MSHLIYSRLSEDGAQLVLLDKSGTEYRVAITDRLRAAVAPADRDPALQMRIPVDGPVTPRDVQRKLRHGASINDVVAESGMPREKVENFAVPVFQERAFVAAQAAECPVPAGGTLGESVTHKLRSRGIDDDPAWDAWRRHDGSWTVVVRFASDKATVPMSDEAGEFLFDPTTKSVVAENDTARWLTNASEVAEPEPDRVIVIEDEADDAAQPRWGSQSSPESSATEIDLADGESDSVTAGVAAGKGSQPMATEHATVESPGARPLSRRAARRRAARKRAERREPTWDEILFGVSRNDDDQ
ncbi:MAG: DUF3071 domain-containing protein [Actinobacteria bacterium]|nr:DUF3071 domain-containing protein [Actinomycetota bacterium]MCB9412741.1 DUF3071 domain-containing protein [Actinomycetota bacterium]